MNPPKVDDLDYIHFLVAAQKEFTCTEAARSYPEEEDGPSHDAFTRLLQRRPPDTEALWQEAEPAVDPGDGLLILDDTTLDKPYANEIEHVTWHWSGKHDDVVKGINLLTLLWRGSSEKDPGGAPSSREESEESSSEETRRETHVPCDFRLYEKDGKTKNEHLREMLDKASDREFEPEYVVFDSWYSGLDNLKEVRDLGWTFFTRLKKNRKVNPDDTHNRQIQEVEIPEEGRVVHLKGYGFVKVFRTDSTDGDAEDGDPDESKEKNIQYWATNDLEMTEEKREELARRAWGVETYHRRLKQYCGVERSQCQSAEAQHNHIQMSIRAFLRLELHRVETALSFYESKTAIIREAIRAYLADPTHVLPSSA
jgi:putative transposase